MSNKQPLLWMYARRVLRYWWVVVVEVVLVATDFVERFFGDWYRFPLWAKVAIGSGVLVVAQYLAYRELAISKENIQAELLEVTPKSSPATASAGDPSAGRLRVLRSH